MAGEIITGHARNFEEPVRRFFEFGGIKSTVAVPVFVEGRWWGFIAFDACRSEREWSPGDIDTLKTLAALVGAAVTGHCARSICFAIRPAKFQSLFR